MADPITTTITAPVQTAPVVPVVPAVTASATSAAQTTVATSSFAQIDKLFKIDFLGGATGNGSIKNVLQVEPSSAGHRNDYTAGSTVIINTDRLILNAKTDHAFLCGKEGVTISSPKSIHIDSDEDVYIHSDAGEVYLGLPNKGRDYDFAKQTPPKTKGDATTNVPYEPVVLGLKLANLLEDLIVLMRDAVIRTPAGDGHMSVEMMYNLENLHSRIPEMLSTAIFVDGVSHDNPDPAPPIPPTTTSTTTTGTQGSTTSGASTAATGTTPNNTQSPVVLINQPQLLILAPTAPTNPDGPVKETSLLTTSGGPQ